MRRTDPRPPTPGHPLSLYIHWPFCLSKCPYCDFNSHVRDSIDHTRWRDALLREMEYWAQNAPKQPLVSIFFGGGTPSLMEPATVGALLERANGLWGIAAATEITLEANPTSVEAARLAGFRAAGVTRISMGIQSLRDADLRFLGRHHSVSEALAAFDVAQKLFPRTSFDLIYARPGQTPAAWEAELREALARADGHLSLYQLTIEPNTAFDAAYRKRLFTLPDEVASEELFTLTQHIMEDAGIPAYEVSNHARPGEECRHNLAYWQGDDYIGIGPGAHGRLTLPEGRVAWHTRKSPERWLAAVESDGHATEERLTLTPRETLEELLLMGLRLRNGISRVSFRTKTGRDIPDALDRAKLASLTNAGFIALDDAALRATPKGMLVLNTVIGELVGG